MLENYFFDIPIYSMSKEIYENKMEEFIKKELNRHNVEENSKDYKDIYSFFKKKYDKKWDYNQIIGYWKLYKSNNQILAHYWKIEKKRIPLNLEKKTFKYLMGSNVKWDIELNNLKSSNEIYNKIISELPYDLTEYYKEGRYLDTSILIKIGPYIDWLKLLKETN